MYVFKDEFYYILSVNYIKCTNFYVKKLCPGSVQARSTGSTTLEEMTMRI
jgi:hypothetical protein